MGRRWRTGPGLVLLALACCIAAAVPAGQAFAADANLELLVIVRPDGQLAGSCLVELQDILPSASRIAALSAKLRASGLAVTGAGDASRWLLSVASPGPSAALPAYLAGGVIVRSTLARYGPVEVWRTYLTIGGPGGFLAELRTELGKAIPEVGAALGALPPATGGGLNLPAAVRLQVPGRVVRSTAPARAGDALHWDVRLAETDVVLAQVTSIVVLPGPFVLWLASLGSLAALGWLAYDIRSRAVRARHAARGGGARQDID